MAKIERTGENRLKVKKKFSKTKKLLNPCAPLCSKENGLFSLIYAVLVIPAMDYRPPSAPRAPKWLHYSALGDRSGTNWSHLQTQKHIIYNQSYSVLEA